MTPLRDLVTGVRSKNAGPFWVTIDVFCRQDGSFADLCRRVDTAQVAALFQVDEAALLRFDMADLDVIKFSLPRPNVQGTRMDRDMHGASFAQLLAEMPVS